MLTVSTLSAFTGKSMGSAPARAPLGIVKLAWPPEKVTALREDGLMLDVPPEPFAGTATVTAVIGRSLTPKLLLLHYISERHELSSRNSDEGGESPSGYLYKVPGRYREVGLCETHPRNPRVCGALEASLLKHSPDL